VRSRLHPCTSTRCRKSSKPTAMTGTRLFSAVSSYGVGSSAEKGEEGGGKRGRIEGGKKEEGGREGGGRKGRKEKGGMKEGQRRQGKGRERRRAMKLRASWLTGEGAAISARDAAEDAKHTRTRITSQHPPRPHHIVLVRTRDSLRSRLPARASCPGAHTLLSVAAAEEERRNAPTHHSGSGFSLTALAHSASFVAFGGRPYSTTRW
jgi:hypothetical protein